VTDPAYKRRRGETLEAYNERIAKMLPPDFAYKTQIDGRPKKPNSK
jgi:hypothetical protein